MTSSLVESSYIRKPTVVDEWLHYEQIRIEDHATMVHDSTVIATPLAQCSADIFSKHSDKRGHRTCVDIVSAPRVIGETLH